MPKDRDAFRERFLRWRLTGELPYEAGKPKHYEDGTEGAGTFLQKSADGVIAALRQARQQQSPTYAPSGKYGINGQLYLDWKDYTEANAAAVQAAANQPQFRTDTRTATERRLLQQQAAVERERYRKQQQKEKAQEGFETLMSLTSPSTYVSQAIGLPVPVPIALAIDGLVYGAAGALKSVVKAAVHGTAKASRNYSLAKAIDKAVTENPTITAYNRNPAIMDAGSLWDYQTYLQQLFPESKIKDILWHGSTQKDLLRFSAKMIGSNTPIEGSTGMYLAPEKTTAANYGSRGGVYPVKLNSKNPYITDQMFALSKKGVNVAKISPRVRNTVLRENDAVVAPKRGEIAFFDPDNALILGSNKDLQEFRSFMNTTPRGLLSDEPLIARGTDDIRYGISASSSPYSLPSGTTSIFEKYLYDQITLHSAKELIEKGDRFPLWKAGQVVDMATPDELKQLYYNSVLPRMQFMRGTNWRGGLLRPTVKSNVDAALERGYTVYDKDIWNKSSSSLYEGFYDNNTGHIAIKQGSEDFALGHEYRHRLDKLLSKSPMESDILEDAYGTDFLTLPEYYPELKDVRMAHEAVTTNFDARLHAIGKYHALNTDWELLNKIIDKLSDDEIIDAVRKSNGYGSRYISQLENNGKLNTSGARKVFADKHRAAMKFVGALGVPTTLALPQLNK